MPSSASSGSGGWWYVHGPAAVLLVIGILLVAGAGTAFVMQGGDTGQTSALGVFDVSYTTSTVQIGTDEVPNYSADTARFDVSQANVTTALVRIECDDQAGAVATYNIDVQVDGPDGQSQSESGTCGQTFTVEVAVAAVPGPGAVQATTEQEARQRLAGSSNATAAQGEWVVQISGNREGAPIGLPAGQPSGQIVFEVEQWTANLSPVQA